MVQSSCLVVGLDLYHDVENTSLNIENKLFVVIKINVVLKIQVDVKKKINGSPKHLGGLNSNIFLSLS